MVIGDPAGVREQVTKRLAVSGADELMVVTNVWSHEARLHSYRLLAEAVSK